MTKSEVITHWDSYLERLPPGQWDSYFSDRYHSLYESEHARKKCFVYQENDDVFIFPFLERAIPLLKNEYSDLESAYGLGGPVCTSRESGFLARASDAFAKAMRERKIIAGFVRFHPVLQNQSCFVNLDGSIVQHRLAAVMNLEESEESIFANQVHSHHRRAIRKAEKNGLEFIQDTNFSHLQKFQELYASTMRKLNADSFYFFDDHYFEKLRKELKDEAHLFVVSHNNRIIAGAFFFFKNETAHYHLAGSDEEFLSMAPNNFLIYRAALTLKAMGAKRLHLGGGTTSLETDPLLIFKQRFTPNSFPFYVGKIIFDRACYDEVSALANKKLGAKAEQYSAFFLKHRLVENQ